MKDKILQNIFEATLLAVVTRSVIVGPNISDALVLIGLLAAMSFKSYLNKGKYTDLELQSQRLAEIENKVSLLSLKSGIDVKR